MVARRLRSPARLFGDLCAAAVQRSPRANAHRVWASRATLACASAGHAAIRYGIVELQEEARTGDRSALQVQLIMGFPEALASWDCRRGHFFGGADGGFGGF